MTSPTPPFPQEFHNITTSPGTVLQAQAAPATETNPAEVVDLPGGIGLIDTQVTGTDITVFTINDAAATIGGELLFLRNSSLDIPGGTLLGLGDSTSETSGRLTGTTTTPLIALFSDSSLRVAHLLSMEPGSTLTLAGPFLSSTDSSLQTALTTETFPSTFTSGGVTYTTTYTTTRGTLLRINQDMTIGPAGSLLSATGSTLTTGDFLAINGPVTSTATGALIQLTNSPVTALNTDTVLQEGKTASNVVTFRYTSPSPGAPPNTYGTFLELGDQTTLAGPLLSATGSTLLTGGDFLDINGPVTSTAEGALIQLTNSPVTALDTSTSTYETFDATTGALTQRGSFSGTRGTFLYLGDETTLAGPLLSATGSTLLTGGDFLDINGPVTSTATGALIQLTNSPVTALDTSTLTYEIFDATTGALTQRGSSSSAYGDFLGLGDQTTLAGPLLSAIDSPLRTGGGFLNDDDDDYGPVTSTATGALIQLTNSPVTALDTSTLTYETFDATTGALTQRGSSSSAHGTFLYLGDETTLAGPLLSATGSTLTTGGDFLDINGPLTSTATGALIQLTNSPVTALNSYTQTYESFDATTGARTSLDSYSSAYGTFLYLGDETTLAGPLLSATGSTLVTGGDFLDINDPVTSTATGALIQLTNSPVTALDTSSSTSEVFDATSGTRTGRSSSASAHGNFLEIDGTMTLAGPLLSATGSTLFTGGDFLDIGRPLTSTATGALIQLTNSPVTALNTDTSTSETFDATTGTRTSKSVSTEFFGAFLELDDPMTLAGPLLSATGSEITTSSRNDFINIIDDEEGFGVLTSTATAPLIQLDASPLTVKPARLEETFDADDTRLTSTPTFGSGNFLSVEGSRSRLVTGGSLLKLSNSSTATTHGAFISASEGALVLIPEAGVEMGPGTNAFQVTNARTPTGTINGIPVVQTNGAVISLGPNSGLNNRLC